MADQILGISPGFGNGNVRVSPAKSFSATTGNGVAATLFADWFPQPGGTFNQTLLEATVLPSSCVARMAIYDCTEDGLPGDLIQEADAEVALSVTVNGTVFTYTGGVRSKARGFFVASILSFASVPTMRIGGSGQSVIVGASGPAAFTGTVRTGYSASLTYPAVQGAMPPTFPAAGATSSGPLMGVRKV